MSEAVTADPRLDWMSQWVLSTTKSKDDKWQKMLAAEEMKYVLQYFVRLIASWSLISSSLVFTRKVILDWFEAKDQRLIVFAVDAKGGFEPLLQFPGKLKAKGAYFLKPQEDMAVTKDSVKVS